MYLRSVYGVTLPSHYFCSSNRCKLSASALLTALCCPCKGAGLRSALRLVPPGADGPLVPSVGDSSPSDSLFKASHTVPSHLPLLLYVVPCGGRVGVWRGRWAGRGGELSGRSSEVTEPARRRRSGHSASRQCSNMASSSRGIQIGSAWVQRKIKLRPQHRGIHLVTDEVLKEIPELRQFSVGLLHVQSE